MVQADEQRELRFFFKNDETQQELSNSIRKSNIRIMGILKGEERKKGADNLFREIIDENFPNLGRTGYTSP